MWLNCNYDYTLLNYQQMSKLGKVSLNNSLANYYFTIVNRCYANYKKMIPFNKARTSKNKFRYC